MGFAARMWKLGDVLGQAACIYYLCTELFGIVSQSDMCMCINHPRRQVGVSLQFLGTDVRERLLELPINCARVHARQRGVASEQYARSALSDIA